MPTGQRGPPHPAVRSLGVEDHGLRHDQRGVAGGRGAPTQVEVVSEDRQVVVEAAEGLEDLATHEHPGAVDGQDAAYVVVLALVVLTALETGLPAAGAGDRDAHLEQAPQRRPLTQLGAEQVGLGMCLGGGEQLLEGVGGRGGVVVEEPEPLRVARLRQAQAHRLGVAGAGRRGPHGAEGRLEEVGPLVAAAGVDADDPVRRPRLGAQAVDHDGQPAGAVVAHHEGGDRPLTCPGHDRRQ